MFPYVNLYVHFVVNQEEEEEEAEDQPIHARVLEIPRTSSVDKGKTVAIEGGIPHLRPESMGFMVSTRCFSPTRPIEYHRLEASNHAELGYQIQAKCCGRHSV